MQRIVNFVYFAPTYHAMHGTYCVMILKPHIMTLKPDILTLKPDIMTVII